MTCDRGAREFMSVGRDRGICDYFFPAAGLQAVHTASSDHPPSSRLMAGTLSLSDFDNVLHQVVELFPALQLPGQVLGHQ